MSRADRVAIVEHLAPSGEAVARLDDGRTVRVAGALPGERVRLHVTGQGAALVEVLAPSPDRVTPRCAVIDACGGCEWQHLSADAQHRARLDHVRRALPPALRDQAIAWHPAPLAYGYRTRARLAWARRGARVLLGFRTRGARQVIDVGSCVVLDPRLDAALGTLHEVLAGVGPEGEVAVALGQGGRPVASIHPARLGESPWGAADALVARGFAGAALWVPGATAPAVAGDPRPVVRGADGAPLVLAPDGFAQANEALNADLAKHVVAQAEPAGRAVVELYAGAGNFTVLLAATASKVTAVESDRAACAALRANVSARGLGNVVVREEPAERGVATARGEVVVLDPPRTGARDVCAAIAQGPAKRVVYVSCDPPTLGRDLAALAPGYGLAALDAFEMFPQTPHVELVATLVRSRRARA